MTQDEYRKSQLDRLETIEDELKNIKIRIIEVETQKAVDKVKWESWDKRLSGIEATLQKLLWIIIGSVVAGIVTFIMSGGLTLV